jgi:hypothetical protein
VVIKMAMRLSTIYYSVGGMNTKTIIGGFNHIPAIANIWSQLGIVHHVNFKRGVKPDTRSRKIVI